MKRALAFLTLSLAATAATASESTVTGSFAPGEMYQAPEQNAPPETSRFSVRTIRLKDGAATVDIPASGSSGLIVWVIPMTRDTAVQSSIRTPSGERLAPGEKRGMTLQRAGFDAAELGIDLPAAPNEVLHVAAASAGSYRVELSGEGDDAVTIVAAEPESPLVMTTVAGPLSRTAGEPLVLRAELRSGGNPVSAASVVARLAAAGKAAGENISLFDDGAHGDGAANDGVYAASVTDLASSEAGFWNVRFDAEGKDQAGAAFARTGSSGFMNERSLTRLLTQSVTASFVGEGRNRVLRVQAPAMARSEGEYRLDVIVAGGAGPKGERQALAWGEVTETLEKGRNDLVAEIPASLLGDGERFHLDIRLLALDTVGLAGRTVIEVSGR